MKRLLVGIAVAATAALSAAPAAADPVEIQECYATIVVPCGVCVTAGKITHCTSERG